MTDNDSHSIRSRVFNLLDKNHQLLPKDLCKLLELSYKTDGRYVANLKTQWKSNYRNRQALKCLSFHNTRGWIYCLKSVVREAALETDGWVATRARNKMLLWVDDRLGRLEWHLSGRVNVWIKKPASLGRAKQLLANAFFSSGLIKDVQIFDLWAGSVRFKGSHLVYDTGERLPYARIDYLKESLGVVIKTGDATHPSAIEVEFHYPDWAERNELMLQQTTKAFTQFAEILSGKPDLEKPERLDKESSYIS